MSPRGGKRKGAGRNPIYGQTMKQVQVRVTPAHIAIAISLTGEFSSGVRLALEMAKEQKSKIVL
jgi:DNA-binding MurR/RpiR family transcriptional regulator